jgi:hypothetical protein
VHVPDTQLPLQHAVFPLHAAPIPAHCPTGSTHFFAPSGPSQEYVQQSSAASQVVPTAPHAPGATHAPLQRPEQHSDGAPQGAPSTSHVPAGWTQYPAWQFPEQQSAFWPQAAPSAANVQAAGDDVSASPLLHPANAPLRMTVSARIVVRMNVSPTRFAFEGYEVTRLFQVSCRRAMWSRVRNDSLSEVPSLRDTPP